MGDNSAIGTVRIVVAVAIGLCCTFCVCLPIMGFVGTFVTISEYGKTATGALATAYELITEDSIAYKTKKINDPLYEVHRCEFSAITRDENDPALDAIQLGDNSITLPNGETIDHIDVKVKGKSFLAPIFEAVRADFKVKTTGDVDVETLTGQFAYYLPLWGNLTIKSDRIDDLATDTLDCQYYTGAKDLAKNPVIIPTFQEKFHNLIKEQNAAVQLSADGFEEVHSFFWTIQLVLRIVLGLIIFGCIALGTACFAPCRGGDKSHSVASAGGTFGGAAASAAPAAPVVAPTVAPVQPMGMPQGYGAPQPMGMPQPIAQPIAPPQPMAPAQPQTGLYGAM